MKQPPSGTSTQHGRTSTHQHPPQLQIIVLMVEAQRKGGNTVQCSAVPVFAAGYFTADTRSSSASLLLLVIPAVGCSALCDGTATPAPGCVNSRSKANIGGGGAKVCWQRRTKANADVVRVSIAHVQFCTVCIILCAGKSTQQYSSSNFCGGTWRWRTWNYSCTTYLVLFNRLIIIVLIDGQA